MNIPNEQTQVQVEIVLSSRLLFGQVPFEIIILTSLLATNYDEDTAGLLFLEKFEDVETCFVRSSYQYSRIGSVIDVWKLLFWMMRF